MFFRSNNIQDVWDKLEVAFEQYRQQQLLAHGYEEIDIPVQPEPSHDSSEPEEVQDNEHEIMCLGNVQTGVHHYVEFQRTYSDLVTTYLAFVISMT